MTVATTDYTEGPLAPTLNVAIPLDFPVHAADELDIYLPDGTLAVLNVDYTVLLASDFSSASLFPAAGLIDKAAGGNITIERDTSPLQTLNLPLNTRIPEPALERALDRSAMRNIELRAKIQKNTDLANRALYVPAGEKGIQFPSLATRAGKIPIFSDVDGEPPSFVEPFPVSIGVPGPNTVGTTELKANSVTSAKIPTGAITLDKLATNSAIATFSSRALLAAWTPRSQAVAAMYGEGGRRGVFVFDVNDRSASVTADPGQGVFIPPASDPTGASGAWERMRSFRDYDVEWFGASTASADNYQAVTHCITLAKAESGGTIRFPQAYQVATPVVVDGNDLNLVGARRGGSGLYRNTAGRVIKFTGSRHSAENLIFYSNKYTATATDYIVWCENVVEFFMDRCWLQGGYHCLAITGGACSDNIFSRNKFTFAMGSAMVYVADATAGVNGSHYFYRNSFNQGYPVSSPNGTTTFKGARGNGTTYSIGDIVIIGAYYFQCIFAGTTAGSPPSTVGFWYGEGVTDNTVGWVLVGKTDYAGIVFDTNTYYCIVRDCDFTSPFQYCVRTRNSFAGDAPNDIRVLHCTLHGPVSIGVYVEAGTQIILTDNDIWHGLDNTAVTYGVLNSGGYDVRVKDNGIYKMDVGVQIGAGRCRVMGGTIANCASGVTVANGLTGWGISGVDFGANVQGGVNVSSINVGSSCDYYHIVNNIIVGASAGITNGSSGASNKTISGNH